MWGELERVYRQLAHFAGDGADPERGGRPAAQSPPPESGSRWRRLRELFGLERLRNGHPALAARRGARPAVSIDAGAAPAGAPRADVRPGAPVLEDPHWSALSRVRPLRYWRLIEIAGGGLLQAPLQIDERILQYLLGVPAADERLEFVIHPLAARTVGGLPSRDERGRTARRAALAQRQAKHDSFDRRAAERRTALFMAMCRAAGCTPGYSMRPTCPKRRRPRAAGRAYTRECAVAGGAACEHRQTGAARGAGGMAAAGDTARGRRCGERLARGTLERPAPGRALVERRRSARPSGKASGRGGRGQLNGELDAIVEAFALDANEIRETAQALEEEHCRRSRAETPSSAAWRLPRTAARRSLDELAARSGKPRSWPDLVLPEAQTAILRQIAIHARQAAMVNEEWGFAKHIRAGWVFPRSFPGPAAQAKRWRPACWPAS